MERRYLEREGELENENGKNETVEVEEWKEQNRYRYRSNAEIGGIKRPTEQTI